MSSESKSSQSEKELSGLVLEQKIKGSRKVSNYLVASMLSIGGVGFLLASFSSYFGKDLLPLGNPSTLIFVPQGLVMGLYGVAAFLLALYFWRLISIDYGSGFVGSSTCLLYTSPSPRDGLLSRMPSSA